MTVQSVPHDVREDETKEEVKAAGLRYVTDHQPGIQRKKSKDTFDYIGRDGQKITDEKTLARIKSLAIPPAYDHVWICSSPNGYLQATGRDAKGRKQYRYHPQWRSVRDETKYGRMMAFGKALPQIRERVAHDLTRPGLNREKILATVVRLLETTLIRVGNEEYARSNHSYGLTTLHPEHVDVTGTTLHFHFRGKSGVEHAIDLRDKRLAQIVKRCRELPGQELFQYTDSDGQPQTIDSHDVNDYLREISGQDFTAKDFRTWAGTVLAALALQEMEETDTETQCKKNIVQAIETVAGRLGNTPSVCRKCYVHPAVIDAYLDGSLRKTLQQRLKKMEGEALAPDEADVLHLLEKRLA